MKTYLIQRGEIKQNDAKNGIDSILSFDYMGAAEYEFNALPYSLKRIRTQINDYIYFDSLIYGKSITVFCNKQQKDETNQYLEDLANSKMHTKLGSYFNRYVKPSEYDLENFKK